MTDKKTEPLLENEYKILANLRQKDQDMVAALGEAHLSIRKLKDKLQEGENKTKELEDAIENHRKQMMSYYRGILEAHGIEKGIIDLEEKQIIID